MRSLRDQAAVMHPLRDQAAVMHPLRDQEALARKWLVGPFPQWYDFHLSNVTPTSSTCYPHWPNPTPNPMPNTYTSLHYHIVFSTKHRERWILPEIEQRIWAYLGGIAKENQIQPVRIGGVEDHVHLLLGAPATMPPSKIAQLIKGGSSAWIHHTFSTLHGFAWQDGYGAFTVSQSHMPDVAAYIHGQREHHRTKTFQEEYLALLQKHQIAYEERYLWD